MVAGYDRSAAIRLQNTMPARPNSKKPYEANSANLTTREKSVTTMPARPNSKKPYEANSANLTMRPKLVTASQNCRLVLSIKITSSGLRAKAESSPGSNVILKTGLYGSWLRNTWTKALG